MAAALPTGSRGRWLALGMTLAFAGAVWLGAVAPLLAWHAERAERLEGRRALAQRMEAVVGTIPALRQRAAGEDGAAPLQAVLLDGPTDPIAGAALQGRLEEMARAAGTGLTSAEALPAEPLGTQYRRIGLRLAVTGTWPTLVRLLQAIDGAAERMLVDDLQIQAAPALVVGESAPRPLNASLTVFAFRAAGAADEAAGPGARQ